MSFSKRACFGCFFSDFGLHGSFPANKNSSHMRTHWNADAEHSHSRFGFAYANSMPRPPGDCGLRSRRGWGSALGQPVGCVPSNMRAVAGQPPPGACQGLSVEVRLTHPCCAGHQTSSDAELVRICDPLGCSGARCIPADMQVGMAGIDASVAPSVLRMAHGYPNTRPHTGIAGWVYPDPGPGATWAPVAAPQSPRQGA